MTWRPWADAFSLTQAVEAPLYVWMLRRALPPSPHPVPLSLLTTWLRALGPSALTHPIVWFVFPPCAFTLRALLTGGPGDDPTGYALMLLSAEAFAVTAEATYWRVLTRPLPLPWADALRCSLLANGASVLIGSLTRWRWGWP